jgi:hypothetical protein
MTTKIAFISGPLSPPPFYFTAHYLPLISTAISLNHRFVLGPSRGTDTLALTHLLSSCVSPGNITVFVSSSEVSFQPRYQAMGVNTVIAGRNHTERDEACTRNSHYDILRYMTEAEARREYGGAYRKRISGTEKNEIRRGKGWGCCGLRRKRLRSKRVKSA